MYKAVAKWPRVNADIHNESLLLGNFGIVVVERTTEVLGLPFQCADYVYANGGPVWVHV